MTARPLRILFAGGGTGGHLFPGLAIADEIKKREPDADVTFVGTKEKIEARVVPQRGYNFVSIWISGFRRKVTLDNLLFPLKAVVALVQSFFLMKKIKPDVVVGTGGYVCGPPLFVATLLGIPTLIQEQNSIPGATTRLLAGRATEVHLSFEQTRATMKRQDNIHVSGNPTFTCANRMNVADAAAEFHLNPATTTLLVFGGSLGATSINSAIAGMLQEIRALNVQVLWQTGTADFEQMKKAAEQLNADAEEPFVRVRQFIDQMRVAYAACHLAVCRAGATTLAELTSLGVPAILVPYPHAAADHQRHNAQMMVKEHAALMVDDDKLNDHLFPIIRQLIADRPRRDALASNAKRLGKPEAAAKIADAVLVLTRKGGRRDSAALCL